MRAKKHSITLRMSWPLLGIIEHPKRLSQFRLQFDLADPSVAELFNPDAPVCRGLD